MPETRYVGDKFDKRDPSVDGATLDAIVSNVTHTGEVTGATALTVDKTAVSDKTLVTAVGSDHVLISDASDVGNLKKALISDFASAGGDMAAATYDPTTIAADAFARANHTGTQTASTVSDFDTEVGNHTDVAANTTHRGSTANPHTITKAQVGLTNVADLKVNLVATSAPTVNEDSGDGYGVGSRWYDTTSDKEYVCMDATVAAAVWLETTVQGGVSSHALGGSEHTVDTLSNVNGKISDATLIDTGDSRLSDARTPTAHETSHESAGSDELDFDQLADGTTYKKLLATERTKLTGIETAAEVNNISDVNATDLTDAGDSTLHYHATDRNRANHTGTQTASTISDFDTEVSNNTSVAANTAKDTNVSTNLSEGTNTVTTVDVNSSDGTNATLVSASTTRAGLLTKAKFDEIVANTAKNTYPSADSTKLAGIETGAEVNNISDANATDLTDGGTTTLHNHDITPSIHTPSAAATATLDLSSSMIHDITMPAGNVTIAVSNETNGDIFSVRILQDATGSRTVTWFSTIKWADGSAPTLTTTASKADTFVFRCTGTDTYDGFIVGQNI